jgi:hypothetical protein
VQWLTRNRAVIGSLSHLIITVEQGAFKDIETG